MTAIIGACFCHSPHIYDVSVLLACQQTLICWNVLLKLKCASSFCFFGRMRAPFGKMNAPKLLFYLLDFVV